MRDGIEIGNLETTGRKMEADVTGGGKRTRLWLVVDLVEAHLGKVVRRTGRSGSGLAATPVVHPATSSDRLASQRARESHLIVCWEAPAGGMADLRFFSSRTFFERRNRAIEESFWNQWTMRIRKMTSNRR